MDKVAVLIPCYNEELTIGKVVDDFKKSLPDAVIYVYDNNSKDKTAEIAKAHGKTAAQVALRFLMQSGVVVIPKSVHEGRIKENFDVFDFELTADEMAELVKMDTAVPMIGNPENPAMVEAAMKW